MVLTVRQAHGEWNAGGPPAVASAGRSGLLDY